MNQTLLNIISTMKPISLKEMDSVALLNRTDTKYVFKSSQLPAVLQDIASKYSILYINDTPFQNYKTTYYDTEQLQMYVAHQNGKANRYKIRHRTYLSTNAEFLEIKFKSNKGVTAKKRIKFRLQDDLVTANDFIHKHTPFSGEQLIPKTLVEYTRLTFVDIEHGERATVDYNLTVCDCNTMQKIDFTHVCIVELKRDKSSTNSIMGKALNEHRIFQKSMSKYAIGTAAMSHISKKNNFKKKLRYIEKLKQNN